MEVEMDVARKEDNEKAFREASDEVEDETMESETEEKIDENVEESESDDSDDREVAADEAEVQSLQTALTKNPYDYASHVALINKLRTMGELDRLRVARDNMSNTYPLSPELWLSWMRDEIKLATTTEQKAEVTQLCERAVKDYMSVEVWLEYLQFSIGKMGTEKDAAKNVRQLFERALTAVGLHTIKGAIIWEAFREFEAVLFALIDATNAAEKKEQLGRIGDLFRRQLACPLLDMEKTHEEYQLWRAEDGAEAAIDDESVSRGYEQALAKLNSLLPYEEKLVSAQGENELLDAYKGYLLYEKQQRDRERVTVLYERAVTDLSLEATIWCDYLTYLGDVPKTESTVTDTIYQRATRNVPWCSRIWQKLLRSYERWERPILEVQKVLENALAVGFSTAEEYRNLWIMYLEYLRRRIEQSSDEEKDRRIDVIRNTFNRACEHLAKYFGLDGDPNCVILQYWARTEAIHASNMEKARTLWADILSQGHSATASYWLEYISLERCYGDTKHLRKLFQRALSSVRDWPESIANAWIDFERDEGTLEQMELCEVKTKEKLDKVTEERQKEQETCYSELSTQSKKANKRKLDDSGKWKNLGSSPSKIVKSNTHEKPLLRESRLTNIDDITPGDKHREESKSKIAPPPGFKKTEDADDTNNQPDVDNNITVFVSNLDYTTTEDEVRDAMKPAGPITLFKMIKDYKGRSKGYCYVQLSGTKAVEEALKLDRTSIKGRPMFVSRCDPNRSTRSSGFKYSSALEKNKLFVKGLPLTTTKEQLEEIFKVHGDLKEVRLVTYRNGHSKGLAYVEYHDEAIAAKALLSTDGMKIQDKVISVAISQPPDRKKMTEESGKQIKSLGGTTTSRAAFGAPKTLLSMVPRNVKTNDRNGSAASNGNGIAQSMSNQDFRNMLFSRK